MKKWVSKIALQSAMLFFCGTFLFGLDFADPFNSQVIIRSLLTAFLVSIIIWFLILILGDILLKGIIEDIEPGTLHALDDGLLQRVRDHTKQKKKDDISTLTRKQ